MATKDLVTTVVALQGVPLSNAVPVIGDVLAFDGTLWTPGVSLPGGPYLPLSGGVMTGAITLPGDPGSPLEAATMQYVDNSIAAAISAIPAPPVVPPNTDKAPVVFFFPGLPAANQIIPVKMAFNVTIANLFAGSQVYVGTNPTAAAVFNVLQNGTSFGTASISTAGAVTWTGGAWALNAGDTLELQAPATQDTTLANVSFTILAVRA